jgi:hypothetical protein
VVRSVNLNYLDPAEVNIAAYQADPDTFVEPHAGEVLYRLGSAQAGNLVGESDGRQPDLAGLEGGPCLTRPGLGAPVVTNGAQSGGDRSRVLEEEPQHFG